MLMSSLISVCLLFVPPSSMNKVRVAPKLYQVQLVIYKAETLPGAEGKQVNVKELANPTLLVVAGKPVRFMVGEEVKVPYSKPVKREPCGIIFDMTITALDETSCNIQMTTEENHVMVQSDELLMQRGSLMKIRGKNVLNKESSFNLTGGYGGEQTWLKFTITEHRP